MNLLNKNAIIFYTFYKYKIIFFLMCYQKFGKYLNFKF